MGYLPTWEEIDNKVDEWLRAIPGHDSLEEAVCILDANVSGDDPVGEDDGELFYCYDSAGLTDDERTVEQYEAEGGFVFSSSLNNVAEEVYQNVLRGVGLAYQIFMGLPFAGLLTLLNGWVPKTPDPVYGKRKLADPLPAWMASTEHISRPFPASVSSWNLDEYPYLSAFPNDRAVAASWVVGNGLFEVKAEELAWHSQV